VLSQPQEAHSGDLQGILDFSVAPGPAPYKIATFVPENKGKPAAVALHHFPELEVVVSAKSFFKAQEVRHARAGRTTGYVNGSYHVLVRR
jgi:uncharacterized protein with WD repeat